MRELRMQECEYVWTLQDWENFFKVITEISADEETRKKIDSWKKEYHSYLKQKNRNPFHLNGGQTE